FSRVKKLRPVCLLPFAIACTGGPETAGAPVAPDGGAGAASSCVAQPENVRIQLCDVTEANTLYSCDQGTPPPRADCTKTVQPNASCCPAPSGGSEGGTATPSGPTKSALYYGACLTEFAFSNVNKIFSFYTATQFISSGAGGELSLSLQPLAAESGRPPAS